MLILSIFLVTIATRISAQTLEDVEAALADLNQLHLEIEGTMHLFMNNQSDAVRSQLNEMNLQTTQEIDDQTANIWSKISAMVDNVASSTGKNDSDTCLSTSKSDLDAFATEMKNRLGECQGYMIMISNELLYTAWSRIWEEYDVDYSCSKMALIQCQEHMGGNCVKAVNSVVENARNHLLKSFELFKAEMTNQILGMNFPCRQMIVQELALYPTLILSFVKSCLDSVIAASYFSC